MSLRFGVCRRLDRSWCVAWAGVLALCVGCSDDGEPGGSAEAGGGAGEAGGGEGGAAGSGAGSGDGGASAGGGAAGSGGALASRSMHLGFSPWPYEATAAAVDDTYAKIGMHGDSSAHHLDAGIPWEEALTGTPYPQAVESELQDRVSRLEGGKPVYLALAPLSPARDELAGVWGTSTNMPREGAWATRDFASPEVTTAYGNFALDLIDRFEPTFFNYGIEVSELLQNDAVAFDAYVDFACDVYARVKQEHPNLPLFVSIALKHPDSDEMSELAEHFSELLPCTDWIGVSTYGYVFYGHADAGDPNELPEKWLSQALDIAPGKPLAIAETGWIAEPLVSTTYGIDVPATEENQRAYVERMLTEADALGARFVMWFTVADFDPLWSDTLGEDPLARLWRDTGLYADAETPRAGLSVWDEWLAKSAP